MPPTSRNLAVQSENDGNAVSRKAGHGLLQHGSKHRAPFGDVSNLAAPQNVGPAGQPKGKDDKVRARDQVPASAAATKLVQQQRSEQAAIPAARHASERLAPLPDIDAIDRSDPLAMTGYANDIHSHHQRAELKYRVDPGYMNKQVLIDERMRAILIDWLVDMHLNFKMMPETLFLTVNLIDRYLANKQVNGQDLQLVGVTCMLIGSKYEEIWAPEVDRFAEITDDKFSTEQILECERLVLKTLQFRLTLPTCYNFLARFLKASAMHLDCVVAPLASYLVELALVDGSMLQYNYSMIAAAAVYVAMMAVGKDDPFCLALAGHSTYSIDAVLPCAAQLTDLMLMQGPEKDLSAVYKKYSQAKLSEVAQITPPMMVLELAIASAERA